jgi:hypothetical protein
MDITKTHSIMFNINSERLRYCSTHEDLEGPSKKRSLGIAIPYFQLLYEKWCKCLVFMGELFSKAPLSNLIHILNILGMDFISLVIL